MVLSSRVAGFIVAGFFLLAACTSVRPGDDPVRIQAAIVDLEEEVARTPDDAEALSDLGVLYLRRDSVRQAARVLAQAYDYEPEDAQTLYFLGLAREKQGRVQDALALYQQYPSVSRRSDFRALMQGRYDILVRQQARREIEQLLAREDSLAAVGDDGLSPDVVAVFPLSYQGSEERYAPLGRGLAEMVLVDLAQVERVQVVERIRLQALLQELELARSEYIDPETAPRSGRLLRAGRVTGGSYDVLADETLRIDAQLWSAIDRAMTPLDAQTGELGAFFRVQKALVFTLLQAMGIELTPEEQEEIERVPTQNLQAFLAYSRGLEEEDAGNYAAAQGHYQVAADLDPEFQQAGTKATEMQGLTSTVGPPESALQNALPLVPPPTPSVDLLGDRIRNLNSGMGTSATPSTGERQPAEEGTSTAPPVLPAPPGPPGSGGN
jgi:tetratricopeptide (TPR) repeat protein